MTTFLPRPHLLDSPRRRDWPASGHGRAGRPPQAGTAGAAAAAGRVDVAIVGAGPAGLAVAAALWHLGVSDVVLLDRDGRPCRRFLDRVDVLRQRVLRSPYQHHPGVEGYRDCELLDFARLHWAWLTPVERREVRMAQAGHRSVVPVDVFEAFCDHVAAAHGVADRTRRATVRRLLPAPGAVAVHADGPAGRFELRAAHVVLCLGEERRAAPADWWGGGDPPPGVSYWDEPVPAGAGPLVVVGAGLSAAHLVANGLAAGRPVRWVLRGERERFQCNDVDASFFRAEGRVRFDGVPWAERLALMAAHRRASVMFEFRPGLAAAEADGRLVVHRGRAVTAVRTGAVALSGGGLVGGEHVVLALGTTPSAGDALLPAEVVAAADGWPDLDARTLAYRRAPRVFAVGAAAGMVLGPAARNIDGHRVATARVAATIAAGLHRAGPAAGSTTPTATTATTASERTPAHA